MTGFLSTLFRRRPPAPTPAELARLDVEQVALADEIATFRTLCEIEDADIRRFRAIAGFRAQQEAARSGALRRDGRGRFLSRVEVGRREAALSELGRLDGELLDLSCSDPGCGECFATKRDRGCGGCG